MLPVQVVGLALDVNNNNSPVVILQEINGTRILPIWIGNSEATAIAFGLEKKVPQRPITHDLLKTFIDVLGGEVVKIIITDLQSNTFYARIFLNHNDNLLSIDARPSDSIALALRTESPIYVKEDMVMMDNDFGQFIVKNDQDKEQELKDYLSRLNPEDLGRIDPDEE